MMKNFEKKSFEEKHGVSILFLVHIRGSHSNIVDLYPPSGTPPATHISIFFVDYFIMHFDFFNMLDLLGGRLEPPLRLGRDGSILYQGVILL